MIYSLSKTIPRSSKLTTFTAVPIGRSSGFCIFGKNPEILMGFISSEVSSNSITTQAYGVKSSNPAGGTVIIVYVTTFPVPFMVELEKRAKEYAKSRNIDMEKIPHIKGWGHKTGPITYQEKIDYSQDKEYVFPHVKETIEDAFRRANFSGVNDLDGIETHDCFTSTEYMAIDHFGITKAGESWKAIEFGDIEIGGRIPINPSGGLLGLGHPVGATGVRMLLDTYKQCSGTAGDYQVEGANNFATLNIGGSATTVVSFVVGT